MSTREGKLGWQWCSVLEQRQKQSRKYRAGWYLDPAAVAQHPTMPCTFTFSNTEIMKGLDKRALLVYPYSAAGVLVNGNSIDWEWGYLQQNRPQVTPEAQGYLPKKEPKSYSPEAPESPLLKVLSHHRTRSDSQLTKRTWRAVRPISWHESMRWL